MRLPNGEQTQIPRAKLTHYLLSETHRDGRSKAKLLKVLGYHHDNVETLQRDLLIVAQEGEVREVVRSEYGVKYIVEGLLQSPNGCSVK